MTVASADPGLYFQAVRAPQAPSPLRSDVAAFIGHTRRGPAGQVVRLEGWRAYLEVFGGLDREGHTPYALRGYFENGGQIAYVLRLAGGDPQCAEASWPGGAEALPPGGRFHFGAYRVVAASPGIWANGARVAPDERLGS